MYLQTRAQVNHFGRQLNKMVHRVPTCNKSGQHFVCSGLGSVDTDTRPEFQDRNIFLIKKVMMLNDGLHCGGQTPFLHRHFDDGRFELGPNSCEVSTSATSNVSPTGFVRDKHNPLKQRSLVFVSEEARRRNVRRCLFQFQSQVEIEFEFEFRPDSFKVQD